MSPPRDGTVSPPIDLLVRRSSQRLHADPSRVITQLFVPGAEGFEEEDTRASAVLTRLLALSDDEVQQAYDDVVARFGERHRDLPGTFRRHARELSDRLGAVPLSDTRELLLGATFTSEYAIEGAALSNPSIVPHPDQTDLPPGSQRFVMSVRAIGEGHRSSIGFRTGVVDAHGGVTIDVPAPFSTVGAVQPIPFEAEVFRIELEVRHSYGEDAELVLDALGDRFSAAELEGQLATLFAHVSTHKHVSGTIELMRGIAERTYGVEFPDSTALTERVLVPMMVAEAHGLEDARFVRFTDDDGSVSYRATYTAYSGVRITQQILETEDFQTFTSSPAVGSAAASKGLAFFPRRINGRYAALSRADRETNLIAFSSNPHSWGRATAYQVPSRAWEVNQVGNCGSPIETDAGWLVLTHGVGPMRTYCIGAVLLDIDDPTQVLGQLRQPLMTPATDEQDGYVPNVVYSCGALVHADTLVLPYGIGDSAIGMASVPLPPLLDALRAPAG